MISVLQQCSVDGKQKGMRRAPPVVEAVEVGGGGGGGGGDDLGALVAVGLDTVEEPARHEIYTVACTCCTFIRCTNMHLSKSQCFNNLSTKVRCLCMPVPCDIDVCSRQDPKQGKPASLHL